jgi:hypothetical protein
MKKTNRGVDERVVVEELCTQGVLCTRGIHQAIWCALSGRRESERMFSSQFVGMSYMVQTANEAIHKSVICDESTKCPQKTESFAFLTRSLNIRAMAQDEKEGGYHWYPMSRGN